MEYCNNQLSIECSGNCNSPDTKKIITVTNNRAQYFANLAKKYRDDAKTFRDKAEYYAKQNSDVTLEYVESVQAELERKINTKQALGDYALKKELPKNISELNNNVLYVTQPELIDTLKNAGLPDEPVKVNMCLKTQGQPDIYIPILTGYNLFDIIFAEKVPNNSTACQKPGTLITSDYSDAVNKIIELYNHKDTIDSVYQDIPCKITADGKYIADISQKPAIDNLFTATGIADFFILDSENNQFYLPKPENTDEVYYCVGEVDISDININIAEISSDIQKLQDIKASVDLSNCTKPYVTETYVNGTSGYRVWSDGWCEQWGYWDYNTSVGAAKTVITSITLLKTFKNTDYTTTLTCRYSNDNNAIGEELKAFSASVEGFSIAMFNRNGNTSSGIGVGVDWTVRGYLA